VVVVRYDPEKEEDFAERSGIARKWLRAQDDTLREMGK
jgi:hypothetical protein